jgi:hypothetical protein
MRHRWSIGILAIASRVEGANLRNAEARGEAEKVAHGRELVQDYESAISELQRELPSGAAKERRKA